MSKKLDISLLQNKALQHNGVLLSTEYTDSNTKYLWQCEHGHQWKAVPYHILNHGVWCPTCGGTRKLSLSEMDSLAKEKGFVLLSFPVKFNNKTKLKWSCKNEHIFASRFNDIQTGYGCPYCVGLNKPDISELILHAKSKAGKLITKKYKNCSTPMTWKCEKNHTWEATWHAVKISKTWCPYCNIFRTEHSCKSLFERLLEKQFKKCRIIPFNNSLLELDGYNKELQLAFEYNGEQHYKHINVYHKTKDALKKQKERDLFKLNWCKENNIYLIVIPYTQKKDLESYIKREIEKWQQLQVQYLQQL